MKFHQSNNLSLQSAEAQYNTIEHLIFNPFLEMASIFFEVSLAIVIFMATFVVSVDHAPPIDDVFFKGYNTLRAFNGTVGVGDECYSLTFDIDVLEGKSLTKAQVHLNVVITQNVFFQLMLNGTTWERSLKANFHHNRTSMSVTFDVVDVVDWIVRSDNFTSELRFAMLTWIVTDDGLVPTCSAPGGVLQIFNRLLFTESTEPPGELFEVIQTQFQNISDQISDDVGTEANCSRKSLEVEKLILNEVLNGTGIKVLEPDVIDIGVCSGSCEGIVSQDKIHTMLLGYHLLTGSSDMDHVKCCIPIEYSSLTLLSVQQKAMEDSPVYEVRKYDDLVVERCGCVFGV